MAAPPVKAPAKKVPTPAQVKAAYDRARRLADESGYGWAISDDRCRQMAADIAAAVVNA